MKKFIALFVAAVAILAVSCKKNDTPSKPSVDLTEINALISQCETLVNGATTAKYPQASIDAFKKVIADVKRGVCRRCHQGRFHHLRPQL